MEERDIKRFLLMFEDIRMVKNKDLKLNLLDKEELNKPELFISFLYKCGAPHSITIIAI